MTLKISHPSSLSLFHACCQRKLFGCAMTLTEFPLRLDVHCFLWPDYTASWDVLDTVFVCTEGSSMATLFKNMTT